MEVIATQNELKGKAPHRLVRISGQEFALFCYGKEVILTDVKYTQKVYMICDAELFLSMVGLEFVTERPSRKTKFRNQIR